VPQKVRDVLEITRLITVFAVCDTLADGLKDF
jgi:hypothetical protein